MSDESEDVRDFLAFLAALAVSVLIFGGPILWHWMQDDIDFEPVPVCEGLPGACDHGNAKPPMTYDSWGTP